VTWGDKLWSFRSPFRHLDTIVSDSTQRQIMVILRLLSSRGGGPDDMWRQIMVIPLTFSPFRHNHVRWHAETNYGHSAPFVIQRRRAWWHAETNYGHFAHLFAIQTQSYLMARRDKLWSFCALLSSRGDRARWHAETNYGHPHAFAICKTRRVINAQRQIMVILHPLSFRSSKSSDKRTETNYGHSAPFVIQEQQVEW